jgi:hypothetical protein
MNNHYDLIIEHLTAIVEEVGENFIYPRRHPSLDSNYSLYSLLSDGVCVYVWQGKPDCIIGRLLHRLGVSLEELSACEGENASAACSRLANSPALSTLEFTDKDLMFLDRIQRLQDGGRTYGNILEFAKSDNHDIVAYRNNS